MYAKQTSHTLPSVQGNGTGGSGTGGSGTGGSGTGGSGTNGSGGGALVGAAVGGTTGGTTGFFIAGPVGAAVGGAVGGAVGAVSVWQLLKLTWPYINVIHQSHTFYFIPRLSGGSKVEQASTVYVRVVLKI